MKSAQLCAQLVGIALLGAWAARAGVVIELETRSGDELIPARLLVDGDRLRLESAPAPGQGQILVFQGDEQRLLRLFPERRRYWQIDRAWIEAAGAAARDARAELEAGLARLDPEQRAVLERMLGAPAAAPPPAPLAALRSHAGHESDLGMCRIWRLTRGDHPAGEICVLEWERVEPGRTAFRALRDLARFRRMWLETAPDAVPADLPDQPFELLDQLGGVPAEIRLEEPGRAPRVTRFRSLNQRELDPGLFALPEGYLPEEPDASPSSSSE